MRLQLCSHLDHITQNNASDKMVSSLCVWENCIIACFYISDSSAPEQLYNNGPVFYIIHLTHRIL